jgi:guanine deaminase
VGELVIRENGYAVCEDGVCRGVFDEIPARYAGLEVIDCGDRLVLPGMVDLHIHAPQFAYRGTGMDYELIEWLQNVAFPEESRYGDAAYALRAYTQFARKLKLSATTRAVIFGTVHADATLTLMDCMDKTGLASFVGKVSMDRYAPPELTEDHSRGVGADTRRFIDESLRRGYRRTKPIVTPRFVPSCTDALMAALGKIRSEYDLPVQSHLSENPDEVRLVAELVPEAAFYGDAYDRFDLFGRGGNTVMSHCVYSAPPEVERMKRNGVWVAHCPSSNMNIASGIAPIRRYLDGGLRIGLGTDVAGGTSESMFRAVTDAIQVSKLYWRYIDMNAKPLTFPEALYLATRGGGAFFGKVGSFEAGYAFDALVLDDSDEPTPRPLPVSSRVERAFYLGLDRGGIVMKFVDGERIL